MITVGALLVSALAMVPMRAVPYTIGKDGETIDAVAVTVYGSASGAPFIVAANGLGKGPLHAGQHLMIPTAASYRLKRGDHLELLAKTFLGDKRRAGALATLNNLKLTDRLREGQEITLPFLHTHKADAPESMNAIAKTYYGDASRGKLLAEFNFRSAPVVPKGEKILVPIASVRVRPPKPLAPKAALVKASLPTGEANKKLDESAARVGQILSDARQKLAEGTYPEGVALLDRALLDEVPSDEQVVEILRVRGELLASLGEDELAVGAFRELLARHPDYACDAVLTSPKICALVERARKSAPPVANANTNTKKADGL